MTLWLRVLVMFACVLCWTSSAFAQQSGLRSRLLGGNRLRNLNRSTPTATTTAGDKEADDDPLKDVPKGTNGVPKFVAFEETPMDIILQAYAEVSSLILIKAPNLPKTSITLKSPRDRELTKDEYLQAIERVLTMNGVVLQVVDDRYLYALDRKTVRTQGIRTSMEMPPTNAVPEMGRVISQVIRLKYISAEEAQKALEGFKDPNGLFQVFERNNSILVTDTQENVNRMLEVIASLDFDTPPQEDVFVRQVQYAVATDIKTALETIVTESQKETQQSQSGPKTSGGPGFSNSRPAPSPTPANRLLNLRQGQNNQQQNSTPNATMTAAVSDADRGMIRGKVLILADERSNKLIVITSKTNMDFFDKVIETLDVETTPEVSVEVLRLKYADAEEVASMLNDLIGNGSSSSQSKNNQNANASRNGSANRNLTQKSTPTTRPQTANPTFSKSASASLGELNKDNIKILADKRINGVVVMARKADMRAVKEVIEDMDVKLSQVLLETVIIQVELGDDYTTGIDWVQRGREKVTQQKTDSYGRPLYWQSTTDDNGNETMTETTTDTGVAVLESVINRDSFVNNGNYMLGGGGGSASATLRSMMNVASNGASTATSGWGYANPIGGGLNYFLKSDKLNIAAVIQATKGDSRTKVLASPIVMTVDNKEATIEATDMIYLFAGYQYSGSSYSGSQVKNYEKRDIGLTVKVTPKINPNGTVMLTIEETIESKGADQNVPNDSGGTDPYATVVTRKMSSDVSVENRQTICMGGLSKDTTTESESGIPILKDIPWIGKWLFSSNSFEDKRSELLVFITPYVLDDASAAQYEALRRKKALSVARPWEDNGWSASMLADPVSKKEQLRRLNEEWAKQDEERKIARELEEAREKRAQTLRDMDDEDRRAWAERHKDEIIKERERFDEEQKDLREIIDDIRRKADEAELEKAKESATADREVNAEHSKAEKTVTPVAVKEKTSEPVTDSVPTAPVPATSVPTAPVAPTTSAPVTPAPVTPAPVVPAEKPAATTEPEKAETVDNIVKAPEQ